jgi:hypothetical protein
LRHNGVNQWVGLSRRNFNFYYSSIGINWTGTATGLLPTFHVSSDVTYGKNRWLAGCLSGIAYSDDGISWTKVDTSSVFTDTFGVISLTYSFYDELFVALGGYFDGTNAIAYSSDGITWTGQGTSLFTQKDFVTYVSGLNIWFMFGYGALYSTDNAVTWNNLNSTFNTGIYVRIFYKNNKLLCDFQI